MTTYYKTPELNSDVWTRSPGCNVTVGDWSGYVTGFQHDGPRLVGVFVCAPPESSVEKVQMLHVRLGLKVDESRHEVHDWCYLTRDEFDRITELDDLRRDLGWRE